MQSPASSPILHKNMLILHLEGTHDPYVVALDKKTGETIWKSVRPKAIYDPLEPVYRKSYQTPIVIEVDGRELMISNAAFMCFAHDINTGEVVWTIEYGYDSTVSQPLYWNGSVFVNSSPVYAGGHIYFFNVKGECTIIKPGDSFQKVAQNSIGETVKAVPAFVRGKIVLRTDKSLYLIE